MPDVQDESLFKESRLMLKMCGYSLINAGGSDYQYLHHYNFWQMNLCNSGTAELELKSYKMTVGTGDIVIFPPGTWHGFHYDEQQKFGSFSFKFSLPDSALQNHSSLALLNDTENRPSRLKLIETVSDLFYFCFPENLAWKPEEFMIPENASYAIIMEDLLFGIIRRCLFDSRNEEKSSLVQRICDFTAQKNGAAVSVSDLAEHLGYSEGHLLFLVRKLTGKTTKRLIDEERIRIAKQFLHYSTMNITELAAHMEFTDIIYFSRFFRKYTGEAPGAYRRRVCSPLQKSRQHSV